MARKVKMSPIIPPLTQEDAVSDLLFMLRREFKQDKKRTGAKYAYGLSVNGDDLMSFGIYLDHNTRRWKYWNPAKDEELEERCLRLLHLDNPETDRPYFPPSVANNCFMFIYQDHWKNRNLVRVIKRPSHVDEWSIEEAANFIEQVVQQS